MGDYQYGVPPRYGPQSRSSTSLSTVGASAASMAGTSGGGGTTSPPEPGFTLRTQMPVEAPQHSLTWQGQQHIQQQDPWRLHKFVFAGGLAGAISRTATAPIDRLKMLLQVQESQRMTLQEGLARMRAEGSFAAYFKGNGTNVLKIAPETSIKLTLNDYLKRAYLEAGYTDISAWERMLIGGFAGAVGQGLVYPLDTVRTRLAVCPPHEYCGIMRTAARIARKEGFAAFYRGLVPSMCGILPYAGVDIVLFEVLKDELLARYDGDPPHVSILGAGMLSSSVAQFVSYPLALVRTRLQAQGVSGMPVKYKGMLCVFSSTLRKEGFVGLYKGLLPNLIKLAPAAGISWYVFEATKRSLGVDPRS